MPRSQGILQPLVRHDTDDGGETGQSVKSLTDGGMTSEEDIESRMSRRSSVIADLLSLFRRSSSVLVRPHTRLGNQNFDDDDEDYDEESDREASKDRILKKIQQKKEIIQKLRGQPWCMKRKRRTLKVAQKHLQQQEAKVSKVRLYKAEAGRKLTQATRWLDNLKIYLIPWEAKIRKIESHFGSVVSSYFTFHRWVLGINISITIIMCLFVIIPEWLADSRMIKGSERWNRTSGIKQMPRETLMKADELATVWDFGGYFEYSLLFYGYYSGETFFGDTVRYRVPVAYFLCNIFVLGFSLFIILRKMASNKRQGTLSSGKTQQYLFNWKSFTGWDFTIGNPETAGNVYMANVIKFREAINDDSKKLNEKHSWLRFLARFFTNIVVFGMYAFSGWAINQCTKIDQATTFLTQNATAITLSLITLIFPNIFDLLGKIEKLHARNALRFQLARVLVLYILNYYTLIYSLFYEYEIYKKYASNSSLIGNGPANNRSSRQTFLPFYPTSNNTHTYFSYTPVTTTPSPTTSPWTTVLPDFGPFGVFNPKASVSQNGNILASSLVLTSQIGPDTLWNDTGIAPTRIPTTSTTTTTPKPIIQTQSKWECWETRMGQEITKLVTMDLYMTVASIFLIDFVRGLACRYLNFFWPWDLERTFPEYGEFKVAENVLHLVNNQGMIWLGLFFVPLLPMLNNIKLIILMYVRGWAAMTCNVPASQIFRASRSSNFFFALLLLFLFLCTLPVGIVIASQSPSLNCGPFGSQASFYSVITDVLKENLNSSLVEIIQYMLSPGVIIPLLVLLLLVIYFLASVVLGLKEANQDLSIQLMFERTEEKKKIFELAGGRKRKSISIFGKRKSKTVLLPAKVNSSDDDSQSYPRSTAKSVSGRVFVPSLGSVSEVDHSTGEEEQSSCESESTDISSIVKLTLVQKFLICIGWSDPKEYTKFQKRDRDIEMEEGIHHESTSGSESDSEEESEERRNSESRYLLPQEGSRPTSRERSEIPSKRSSGSRKTSQRDFSYRTAIQSLDQNSVSSSSKSTTTAATNSEMNRVEITENPLYTYVTPLKIQKKSSSGSSGSSNQPSSSVEKQAAKRLLQPISTSHNVRYGLAVENASADPTRPPSTDGSLADTNINDPLWLNLNPHSSYTSAMMSPIMNEFMSTDETTDDEKGRLIPDRPPIPHSPRELKRLKHDKDLSSGDSKPSTPRPPRFRISMSPPRKTTSDKNDSDSSNRKYEMRVEKSSKKPKNDEITTHL